MTTPLPVSLVYGSKTRPDDPSPLRFLLLDVTEEGMAIVAPLSNTCIDTAFSSLEQAEGWLLRDPRWKHCREDAAVLDRFWIKHDGAWQSLRHALEVEGLRLRARGGDGPARRAKAPARASDRRWPRSLPGFPRGRPPLIKGRPGGGLRRQRRSPPRRASWTTVAKARCARQLLGAYHLDRHHHPLASASTAPWPQGRLSRGPPPRAGLPHDGTEDEDSPPPRARAGEAAAAGSTSGEDWAGRVREPPTPCSPTSSGGTTVLLLGEAALPGGGVPLPQAPSASSLSPVAKPWARQAFREMASWLARAVGLAGEADDALTTTGSRPSQGRIASGGPAGRKRRPGGGA